MPEHLAASHRNWFWLMQIAVLRFINRKYSLEWKENPDIRLEMMIEYHGKGVKLKESWCKSHDFLTFKTLSTLTLIFRLFWPHSLMKLSNLLLSCYQ